MRWAGHVAGMGEMMNVRKLWKPEGTRSLEIPKCKWEDNIKMELKSYECVDCIYLSAQGLVAGSCEHGDEQPDCTRGG
jgi:hypothetical protein